MLLSQVGTLIEQCNHQAIKLHRRAVFYKWFGNLGNSLVICCNVTAGFLSIYDQDLIFPVAICSFGAALIKGLMVYYSPEKRALALANVSIENNKLSRKLRKLDIASPNVESVKSVIDKTYARLDELKLLQFSGELIQEHGSSRNLVETV